MKTNVKILAKLIMLMILSAGTYYSGGCQNLPRINNPFPDFSLLDHQGERVTLSRLKGKNIMLIFPRGKVSDHWCQLCHYQYAELAKLEVESGIREKYNLEILFLLPYPMEEVILWTEMFPSQMADIARWKGMPTDQLNPEALAFLEAIKDVLPQDFHFADENPAPLPFPVLADEDHELSMKIKLFSTAWDGYYTEQNEPAVFILDQEGIVRFKYKSQETWDRPPAKYLLEFIENMMTRANLTSTF